jgi:hypothetical protein
MTHSTLRAELKEQICEILVIFLVVGIMFPLSIFLCWYVLGYQQICLSTVAP